MGSIRRKELSSGKSSWEARVIIKGHPQLSKSFAKKQDAKDWVASKEATIRGGGKVSRKAEKTTVEEALSEYLAAHEENDGDGEAVSTLTNTKRYAVESVRHHLGEFTIDRLTTKLLNGFLKKLQATAIPEPANKTKTHPLYDGDRRRTYSPGSARKLFYALKTAVEWHATEHGYPLGETFKGVEVPPAWSAPRVRRLNDGEEAALMEACGGMYKDPEGWRLLISLALETAMRAGELLGMQWDEVRVERSHRFIAIPAEREKTRVGRQVPLSSRALAILAKLKKRADRDDPRVFSSFPNSSVLLGKGFKRITARAGCDDLRFHDLRHEATARLFERTDMQTLEIALMTGHTQLETLKRYANLRPNILAEKLDGKGKALSQTDRRLLQLLAKLTGAEVAR
jgi:integrase